MFTELKAIIRIAKNKQYDDVETLATRLAEITAHPVTIRIKGGAYRIGNVIGSTDTGALVIRDPFDKIYVGTQIKGDMPE